MFTKNLEISYKISARRFLEVEILLLEVEKKTLVLDLYTIDVPTFWTRRVQYFHT